MSKKKESFKHHSTIIGLSREIFKIVTDAEGVVDSATIASLAKVIETEAHASWQLTREILEDSEFDDLGPTE